MSLVIMYSCATRGVWCGDGEVAKAIHCFHSCAQRAIKPYSHNSLKLVIMKMKSWWK